jgi:hypothetical protein
MKFYFGETEPMIISGSGYLGLGTLNPTTYLDVDGQIRIRG